jgi:uncharacterized protein YutE (UPF0331/DUF86 family)
MDLTLNEGHHAMDWLEWSATIVKAVAWPGALVFILFLFRTQLVALLANVESVTVKDTVVNFRTSLTELEDMPRTEPMRPSGAATATPPPAKVDSEGGTPGLDVSPVSPEKGRTTSIDDDRFEKLLAISPEAAILDAWQPIVRVIDELTPSMGLTFVEKAKKPFYQKIRELHKLGIISSQTLDVLKKLSDLRNQAAHLANLSAADAVRFKQLSEDLLEDLESRFQGGPVMIYPSPNQP